MLLGSPVGDKSRVLTQPHLTATDSRASTIQWIGFLNDHFYARSNIAAPAELSIPFCLMKNPLLYRSAWPESSRGPALRPRSGAALSSALPNERSVLPVGRYPTKDVAVDRHMADGRERQVSGHQRLAVRRQLPQKTDPDAGRLLGGAGSWMPSSFSRCSALARPRAFFGYHLPACAPPSTCRISPVVNVASVKNKTASTTSWISPILPTACKPLRNS